MLKAVSSLGSDLIGKKNSRYQLPTPSLVLDLDALEKNIEVAAKQAHQNKKKLRPHCKGHKSGKIAKLQMEAGAIGISCATLGEAETIASFNISPILITSPIVPEEKIFRLIALNQKIDNLMVVVDHLQNIHALSKANEKNTKPLQVLVDLDIGHGRTGAKTVEEAMNLVQAIRKLPYLQLVGIQAYGGHVQHLGNYLERQKKIRNQNKIIDELSQKIHSLISSPLIITGGGTGTFDIDLNESSYTELQIGSYTFMDVQYNEVSLTKNGFNPFLPSLFVLTTVISTSYSYAIVDAGLKSFATDGPNPKIFSGAPLDATFQFMGDEHGKIGNLAENPPLASVLEFITPHCDPTVNLYDFYHCVRGNTLVDIWPIDARGFH